MPTASAAAGSFSCAMSRRTRPSCRACSKAPRECSSRNAPMRAAASGAGWRCRRSSREGPRAAASSGQAGRGESPMWPRKALLSIAIAALLLGAQPARTAEPIKIGFSMALTGGLAVVGKSGFVALQIWASDINAKGGLLGRPVSLVYYDDQSNPANVPGIYTKLLDVDKVDLVISGYATTQIAPAMPIVIEHGMVFFGMFGLAVNSRFQYPRYFSILPSGPEPKRGLSQGFFDVAAAQQPRPQTVAIIAADTEFSRNASDGARDNVRASGFKIVYDKTYPPGTVDFSPILRSIQASSADIVYVASYPSDTVGIVRAASEVGLKTKVFGGSMVGMATASMKTQLGPLLNGIIDVE